MFRINLHRHVRIWFHKDTKKENFINYENRLRLIEFRKINPTDELSFVYSKELLSEEAKKNLLDFCEDYAFYPVAIEDLASEMKTDADQILYKFLKMEIAAAKDGTGGNLAAASDIARWLGPVRARGIYADLDVDTNTNGLPKEILVDKPFVTSYGSIIENGNMQSLVANNDILMTGEVNTALPSSEQAQAQKELSQITDKVVEWMVTCYASTSEHISKILNQELQETKTILPQLDEETLEEMFSSFPIVQKLCQLASKSYGDTPIEIRGNLDERYSSCYQFAADEICKSDEATEIFISTYGAGPAYFISNEQAKHKIIDFYADQTAATAELQALLQEEKAEKYTQRMMEEVHHTLYKELVIHTTGPKLFSSIMGKVFFRKKDMQSQVAGHALCHYRLDANFKSKVPLYFDAKQAPTADKGKGSDLYWLPAGKKEVEKREQELAAIKIQRQWRLFHPVPKKDISSNNGQTMTLTQNSTLSRTQNN